MRTMTESDKTKRTENILAATLVVLLGAVLLTSHAVSGVMARYTTAGASHDEARVALFGHNESIDFGTWSSTLKPGSSGEVTLTVSNKRNGKVSEVAQSYGIQVVTSGNLPLRYTLKDVSGNTVGTFDEGTSATSQTFSTSDMTFEPATAGEHTYTLVYSWPGGQNGSKLADIPDFLQVNVNVTQID